MSKRTGKMKWLALLLAALLGAMLLVPWPFGPPAQTRIIMDHTEQVYVAPPCFEQAGLSNYLTETTWGKARVSEYRPESACTSDMLQPVRQSLWKQLWQGAGLSPSPWSW